MNPNPEIYGAPETWQTCKYFPWTGTSNPDIKLTKPKIPNFNGQGNGSLGAGDTAGKTRLNIPIDKSLCPCGQDNSVSCLGDISIFQNAQNVDGNKKPTIITPETTVSNWFIYDGTAQQADFANQGGENARNYVANKYQLWAPDGETGTTHPNMNLKINPFLDWGTRSLLLQIKVQCITGYDHQNKPYTTWRYLKNWYDNYDQQPICGVSFIVCGRGSVTGTNITYRDTKGANNNFCGIGILDKIDGITDYYRFNRRAYNDSICEFRPFQYLRANYYSSANTTVVMFGIHRFDTMNIEAVVDTNTQSGWSVWPEVLCTDSHYNTILKWAACFGLPFTDKEKYTFNADYLDEDLYLPIIDNEGITHGEYTKGADNAGNPYVDLDTIRDKNYDPSKHTDPNTYSNITGFNYITEGAAMTVRYVLDGANVDKLLSDLWTINASIAQGGDFEYFDGKIKDEYLTTNPIDCIVSLIRYPFNIPYQIQPLQSYVKLGKTTGSAKGWTTVYISNQINFQGINIFPRFGDCFLDYEPYTSYELYVPFCGTTKIRAADILGHTLNVTMLIDLITGSCTAYVKADQLVIETLQGSCGVQQQISGTDTATMNANIYNGILAQKQAKTGIIAQGASALLPSSWVNPVSYAAKGEQAEASYKQATFAIEHIETPVHSQGAASPLLGWIQEFDARLMIYYPEGDVIDGAIPPSFKSAPLAAFGHLKGFTTVTPGTVGAFRSNNAAYVSGDIIADNIPCTLSERNRIKSMFADGVYLPPL